MDNRQSKILIVDAVLIVVIAVISVLYFQKQGRIKSVGIQSNPIISQNNLPIPTNNGTESTEVVAPDGKLTLTMKLTKTQTPTYTLSVTDNVTGSQKEIFSKPSSGNVLSIPFNTFSPDDKYVFLKEETGSTASYFVLSSSGTPFGEGVATLDISSPFVAKYTNYKITDVTGWGGTGLVVVNTDKTDGTVGPSFWYSVSGHSFIQLSNRFN